MRRTPRLNQFPRMLLVEWRKLKLPMSDETIVVAVSGGADSTALLLALSELKSATNSTVSICVAHLDHRLRKIKRKDAKWVSDLADETRFRSVIGRSKVAEDARANKRQPRAGRTRGALRISRANREESLRKLCPDRAHDGRPGRNSVAATDAWQRRLRPRRHGSACVHSRKNSSIKLVRPLLWARRSETEDYCRLEKPSFCLTK